jgi:8-oxo-dGTP pyrophosphatase MutT (NUDIX family)
MREAKVVTCFLLRRTAGGDEVLLLRRSQDVGTYRGRWAGVSGYLEAASPLAQAYREVEEEAGLMREEISLLQTGEPLEVSDPEAGQRWIVHPFLFEVAPDADVRIDWEHTEARWVRPEEILTFETVPQLAEALMRVYPLQRP